MRRAGSGLTDTRGRPAEAQMRRQAGRQAGRTGQGRAGQGRAGQGRASIYSAIFIQVVFGFWFRFLFACLLGSRHVRIGGSAAL
ncbi:hypothetical protein HETIRDRAFT_481934 [Heterobasidion irregulare TC 32-1]|uniref:Uncharacterized protein n=1 Tax=Heterobasidion irregulare (strain TC 32-1) TaxID=747525 RepID=W4JNW3_HETIT|nr:uncharacterized protein HETIRDRAFT_481934 [Heterobasidion irregulare TC 32-1]ETW75247.1 hypothetical protein HETIRDRAFT_481934 [Heterobasidion irregulare TC 32-1]